jgi:hypothetical protein
MSLFANSQLPNPFFVKADVEGSIHRDAEVPSIGAGKHEVCGDIGQVDRPGGGVR